MIGRIILSGLGLWRFAETDWTDLVVLVRLKILWIECWRVYKSYLRLTLVIRFWYTKDLKFVVCTLFYFTDFLERETMQSSTVYVAVLTIALQFDSWGILPVCLHGILLIKEVVNGMSTVSVLMPDLQ